MNLAFLGHKTALQALVFASIFAPEAALTNLLFRQFIEIYMKHVEDQSLAKPRNEIDWSLKPENLNLYHGYLYVEYYYLCQHSKDYLSMQGH